MSIEYAVFYTLLGKRDKRVFSRFDEAEDFYKKMKYGSSSYTDVTFKFRRVGEWEDTFEIKR